MHTPINGGDPEATSTSMLHSPLVRIQGTMTTQRYMDDVLRPVTLSYLQRLSKAFYQQDNARQLCSHQPMGSARSSDASLATIMS
ncbi:hypothetical protein NPIL_165481 [Nephila pilipes]|uniref:Uncharacterized protein n=1 Tax=Nephila pilipes TaxID=299642 RepID=A0A8X6NCN7_NEPPI|nr:hypothetical protein NPIL_165481 [Nephila pilipes]